MLPRFPRLVVFVVLTGTLLGVAPAGATELAGEPVRVAAGSSEATNDNGQRKLIQTSAGNLELIFVQQVDEIDQIVVASSADSGETWSEPVKLSRDGIPARLGSLAEGPDGRLHAAWVDYETVGHVWYAVRADGTWSPASKISPGPTYAGFPVLAAEGDLVHVLWYSSVPDEAYDVGSRYEIIHVINTAGVWGPRTTVVSQGGLDALNPAIAQDRDGVVHAAWYERDIGRYQAHYAYWLDGRWQGTSIVSTDASDALGVAMDVDPAGTVHLVWEQFGATGADLLSSSRTAGGWSTPATLAAAPAVDPVIASDDDGHLFAAWSNREEVFLSQWKNGRWAEAENLGAGVHPTLAPGERVRIAWTRPAGANYEVVTAAVLGAAAEEGISLPDSLVWTSGALFALAVGAMAVFFYRHRVRRPRSARRAP
jgi:hypothetical protein